nr:hypothetical protein [uncultured bacterium]AMP54364.1 hypothetical protein [uncultured bacterium]
MLDEKVRKYLYGIGAAIGALTVSYGIISDSDLSLWLGLLGAVLMVGDLGMATAFTGKNKKNKTSNSEVADS